MGQMRLSGLISGMDTDTIIQQLVSAKRLKVTKKTGDQTKLSWKQDIWKDLNKELQKLHTGFAAKMRFSSAFQQKKTTVSNPSVASVIAGSGAMDSVQELKVEKLAKAGYLTGGEVALKEGAEATELNALTKLTDLGYSGSGSINITVGKNTTTLDIDDKTTISDFLNKAKEAGLNASFDTNSNRLFVSAKTTGEKADFSITGDDDALSALGLSSDKSTKIKGEDAIIYLNDAKFTSSSNTFSVNGLTITATGTTKNNESVTLTTVNDTDKIYDVVKDFLKQYNAVVNKIDKLYNAPTAKGYEPLTDDEKESMSESEITKYEDKIKDSLLRGDNTLSQLTLSLTSIMSSGLEVNGKKMYLSDFGISTGDYFTTADNEKHALHIAGDPDDESFSGKEDKLKSMIASDPDSVVSFFTQMSKNLYSKMNDLSKSQSGYRTFGSFYNDLKMKSDYTDYKTRIAELEEKANDYEDKLYKKFSAMETALAKLQKSTSAITGLMGQ